MFTKLKQLGTMCLCALGVIALAIIAKPVTAEAGSDNNDQTKINVDNFEASLDSSFDTNENGDYYTWSGGQTKTRITYETSFSLSGEEDYDVGAITIRIPAAPFHHREGNNTAAAVAFSIPKAPSTSSKIPFNYYYDEDAKEYVIQNTETLPAATEQAFTFEYTSPYEDRYIKSGTKTDDFYATIKASTKSGSISETKTAPGVIIYSNVKHTSHNMYGSASIRDGYLYILWTISSNNKTSSQTGIESLTYEAPGGEIVRQSEAQTINSSLGMPAYQSVIDNSYQVETRYPITDELKNGKKHVFSLNIKGNLLGDDGATDEWTDIAETTYMYSIYSPSPDSNSLSKGCYNGEYNGGEIGSLDRLQMGQSVDFAFTVDSSSFNNTFAEKNNSTWHAEIIDEDLLLADNTQLTSKDFEIKGLISNIAGRPRTVKLYEYKELENGWKTVSIDDDTIMAKIYVNTDGGPWIYLQDWNGREDVDMSGKGYTGIKIVGPETEYACTISARIVCTLKPTDYILSLGTFKVYNVASLLVRDTNGNIVTDTKDYTPGWYGEQYHDKKMCMYYVAQKDVEKYGTQIFHSCASDTFRTIAYSLRTGANDFYGLKKGHTVTQNVDEQCSDVEYSLRAGYGFYVESNELYTPSTLKDMLLTERGQNFLWNSYPQFNKATFYDLLPAGAELNEDKIRIYTSGGNIVKKEIKTIDNFKNTGQTMLIIDIETENNFSTSQGWSTRINVDSYINVYYSIKYSFESAADYGASLKNSVALKNNMNMSRNSTAQNWEVDISEYEDVSQKTFLFAWDYATAYASAAAELSLSKAVKDSDNNYYSQGHDGDVVVSDNENYFYRLRFGSASGTTTKNIILFDSIENYTDNSKNISSGWRGILQSVDLSQPKLKGIDPVVYYSTIAKLSIDDHHDITDSSVWIKLSDDTDLSKATAIAVDMRKRIDGTDYELPEKETIRVTLNMKAPTGDSYIVPAREGKVTYNNVYLLNDLETSTGYENNHFIHYDYTEVSLLKPVESSMRATKEINDTQSVGITLKGDDFTFNLLDEDGTVLQTKKNDKNGKITFEPIEYKDEGEYKYQIKEVIPEDAEELTDDDGNVIGYWKDGITYDTSVKDITLKATEKDGTLEITRSN